MIKQNLVALLCTTIALTACAKSKTESAISEPTSKHSVSSKQDPVLQKRIDQLVEKTKKNMIFIEGGTFMMGDFGPLTRKDKLPIVGLYAAMPAHKVTLDSFSLNAYKTTFDDFDIYTDSLGLPRISMQEIAKIARQPMAPAGISWQQASDYCQWLGKQVGIPMNLPTEAQWEYAARNKGQYVIYPTDNGNYETGRNVWSDEQRREYSQSISDADGIKVAKLGKFPPTPLGFYDMATDNYEWMSDWFDPQYYKNSPELNPQGPKSGKLKSVRSTHQEGAAQSLAIHGSVTTIYRSGMEPNPQFDKNDLDGIKYLNPNSSTSVRCASNSPRPFPKP
ncbi:formylglycine-generating enzyme family protein [Acinetobacter sp. YH12239]|uniref:formylglycine-generating enzyme family protein n=1 Tax=Acinetobacter sp. YH12239 TaxID=2601166 RepID=UPI00359F1607